MFGSSRRFLQRVPSTIRIFNMSTYTATTASPFTRAVITSMRKLYPESLADKSFDNTGLLLEAPFDPIRRQMNSVLLTIDVTKAVTDEAIERKDCVVVAYHPIIFRGLKSLTLDEPQQQSLLRLALEGISVYCPHTAVDSVPGGMADWLCDIVTGRPPDPEPETPTADPPPPTETSSEPSTPPEAPESHTQAAPERSSSLKPPSLKRQYSKPTYPILANAIDPQPSTTTTPHSRQTIHPHPTPHPDFPNAGFGRLITFSTPQPLTNLIERIARGVGNPAGFPVAIPQGVHVEDMTVTTVGICPGSGASVLLRSDPPPGRTHLDLIFTGELSHHEALAAIERGTAVVSLFHSNTERGFLHQVMRTQLEDAIREEWKKVREEESSRRRQNKKVDPPASSTSPSPSPQTSTNDDEDWEDALRDESVSVQVSERDRDPFGIVLLQDHGAGEGTEIQGK